MIAALALLAGLYPLAGWLGSALPRNPGWHEAADDTGITIMVESNGTHTGLVVPLITPEKDWRATFPEAAALRGPEATHLALGWGEHEVFLAVETWRDLTPLTALRIATIGGPSVMRATPYIRPVPSAWHRPLRLSRAQYARLVRRIEASLAPISPGTRPRPIAGTDPRALYYRARGRYTLLDTCNSWTGDTLAAAGVRIGRWTPFAGGVMQWVAVPRARQAGSARTERTVSIPPKASSTSPTSTATPPGTATKR